MKHRPRIFFLALDSWSGEGGIQRHNRRLQKVLQELSESNQIDTSCFMSIWDDRSERGQNNLSIRGVRAEQSAKMTTKQRLLSFARALVPVLTSVRKVRPTTIVLAHRILLPFSPILKLLSPTSQQVLVIYGVEAWTPFKPIENIGLKFINQVVSISKYTAAKSGEINGALSNKPVTIIPCAIDELTTAPTRSSRITPTLVTASRLAKQAHDKNIDKIIEAMPAVAASIPGAELRIVGDGDDRARLQGIASSCGARDSVTFLGRVDDKAKNDELASADIFVLPSTREGFGIVYLEGWQYGLPVIGGNDGAATEVISDGTDGFCVAPTAEAIADAAVKLLSSPELRKEFAANGLKKVETVYSHKEFSENWSAVLLDGEQHKPTAHVP